VIGAAFLVGAAAARWAPDALGQAGAAAPSAARRAQPALIDDHSPTPDHARPRWGRLLRVLLAGLLLGLLPLAALVSRVGWEATLTQMAWFFAQAAFLTFGGAYAVLPYVQQAAVDHYGWLSTPQMMDGLALGETTPGPLIMVVAFVGFVGGWLQQVLGPDAQFMGAALAACVATWFTFLPSFLFILAGGPWVESTRGRPMVTVPLAAVTCAVVGVIAQLALWFLSAVVLPGGVLALPDLWALALVLAAAWALWRLGWSVLRVIAVAAGAGLLLRLMGWA
jgi:chromate transporter